MAHDDKDRLADLLGKMTDGDQAGDPAHPQAANSPNPSSSPAPGMPTPKPVPAPPAPQRPVMPQAPPPTTRSRPLPPQPAPSRVPAAQAPIPQAAGEPAEDDDAVIVPPPPVSALAHTTHRPRYPHQQGGLSLGFKRTMIPLLLTLGIEMFALILLGAFSPADSTFRMFFTPGIAITLAVLGFVFVPAGLFLMLQVRNELRNRPPA